MFERGEKGAKKAPFWTLKNRKKDDFVLPPNSQKQLDATFAHIRTAYPETASCALLNKEGELMYATKYFFYNFLNQKPSYLKCYGSIACNTNITIIIIIIGLVLGRSRWYFKRSCVAAYLNSIPLLQT